MGKKIYNMKLDTDLIKQLDHISVDSKIPRQELIDRCIDYTLQKIKKSKKVEKQICSLT